ncbi:mucin-5B [Sorex araneus]|uniref:mucin-5B n=1 Tax=Sorex araneus TaxID=42254 RepID=UPI00243405B9|nr:mucin-5B [Sorex araneus]
MAAFKVHDPSHPVPTYQGVGCWLRPFQSYVPILIHGAEMCSLSLKLGASPGTSLCVSASPTKHLTFVPSAILFPTISPPNPAHNGRVCSTWGDFHYKTFDGAVFRFPGLCNYVLSAHCGGAYEDFNVQLRRGVANARPTITRVVLRSQGLVLEASNGSVLVDGQRVKLPFARAGLLVEKSGSYIKVSVRLVLTFMWNGGDSALLELDPKYTNQTCGLCGDFNGLPVATEFYAHNARLTPLQFGNLQKMDGPTEQCQDPLPSAADNCTDEEDICRRTLLSAAFSPCHALVDPEAYVAACIQDLCRCPTCPCATFAEYSRQCAHAGGQPQNWRRPDLCPATCPLGMQHLECGSPCADTCSNPERAQLCEDHCVDGCFCPDGTVWDDVGQTGCVPLEQCSCTHGGRTYAPGASFTSSCSFCTCSGGRWQCQDLPCPGTCSVQGGAHVSTYDEKLYDLHGDCSYVLSKRCADSSFTVLAELRKCGLTDTENCLKAVTLSLDSGDTTIRIQSNGAVFMNSIYTQLPVSAANITILKPTSFFIILNTALGLQLQVQLVPLMQVFLHLLPEHRGQMCGLCGNFNQNQADDFRALSGVVEGTAAAFANTWKTQAACPNVRNSFEDPCSLSVENENYAQHWCSLLTHPASVFAACHGVVNPTPFHSNCMFDTCNCEKSEDCMCAALSSYVRACAAKGVLLDGWRDGVCTKYMSNCPKSQRYAYMVDSCQPTCRALSQADVTCAVDFVPVDGCTCPPDTFLDDAGACVPAEACPCYFRGSIVAPGEVVHDNGIVCSCSNGKLSCLGAEEQKSRGCVAPMVYLDCNNASAGTPGAECLRSCHTLDVDCFSTHCVSGCVCPLGLVSDGNGGCVAEEDCPCLHNDATYRPGDTIRVDCNTCTCKNRRWECSRRPCLGTCVAYGDGHFITFDGERYSFDGSCEYTLAQDHCGSSTTNGTFRIVTENVPCGTTGVTCSKAIKIFLGSYELILHEGTHKVVQRGPGEELPYKVRLMGIYLVVETRHGLVVSWDRRTSVFIRLRQDYKGRVCGLCGNFDDKAINDFTTRGQSVVGNALEFGNSWKFSPSCPDAPVPRDPCTANPYRKSWAQKQCSLINSATFAACHAQVDPSKYYEACVSDACACDSGGDCECFCTAVAAYAQACRDVGVCVSWRTPDICPLFCDYYNPHGECEWHYEPCGAPCLKTCRNPSGRCLMDLPGLEGCYPRCPPSKPFFSEEVMSCVARCGCYDEQDNYYDIGTSIPTAENCQRCNCTAAGVQCTHSPEACTCIYEGRTYGYKEVIYNTTDGLGGCLLAVCGDNGTITRTAVDCPGTPATTPFTFTTTAAPIPTTGWVPTVSTVCVRQRCQWSSWYDSSRPQPGMGGGDFETFVGLRQKGYPVCAQPAEVECRAQQLPSLALAELGQKVECSLAQGLVCLNSEQSPPLCHNYEIRVLCCDYVPCATPPAPTTPRPAQSSTTLVPPPASPPTPTGTTPASRPTAASPSQAPSSGAPEATSCQPRCQWTEWFDTDYPESAEDGGDVETYDRIRSAGGDVCAQPQDIECQAENFPDQAPEELGQRVHCDVSFGLECRNQEQPGLFKMCYNYRVRVLCCSYSHCGLPTTNMVTSPTVNRATSQVPNTATSTTAISAMANTATTNSATPTATSPATEPGTMPGTALGSTTAPATPPAGATSLLPSLPGRTSASTVGSPTPAPGTATPSSPGQAMSVHPSHTTTRRVTESSSQEATPMLVTVQRSTTRPATGAQVGGTSTVPPGSPTPYVKETSTDGRETGPATAKATTSTGTTDCQPRCEWTEWLDVDFPTSGVMGGDIETFENIRAAGGRLCEQPQKIECRAENYPEVSIDQIGQVLTCSLQTGLVCRNRDQKGPFNMCFNYNIRVLCCDDYRHCPSTAQPAHTRTATQPALSTTPTVGTQASRSTPGSQTTTTWHASSGNYETASVVTPYRQTTSRSPGTRSPSTITLPSQPGSATPTQATSPSQGCEPQCTWTDWFDEDYPTPGPNGGDFETLAVLRDAGHVFCEQPEDIECRSELEPQVALEELDQVVVCNVSVGLVCRNREQPRPLGYCHNYHVRLLCCDYSRCASSAATTATRPTTPATTSTPVVPTTGAISPGQPLSPEASPGTTLPPPSTETGITLTTTKMGLSTRSLPPSPTPKATDSPGSTPSGPSTSASTASGTPGPVQTTPLLTSAPPAASMTPGTGTTACQPRCSWSEWLNESSPVPGATGGDFETYASLRAAGHALCKQPVALECRAAAQPDVPLSELGQVVQCRLQDGLVCRNRDQAGRFEMCLDYQVRVLCCDYSHCPATPATTTTTPAPSTWPHSALPSSTSTQSPMAPSTSPAGTTSGCQPACRWTDWLDSDQPLPGRYGGDIETYYHIESVHGRLCPEPVAIQCEAVLFPGLELQQLGQVVQCDVHYGLICRNSWQMWGRNCLNYHVRVQCCDDYSHCASSPAPATSSGTSTGQPTSEGTRVGTSATTEMRPSSPVATASATLSTTQTRVSSPGATASATKSTTETGPSSPGATPSATKSTTETGPSSPGPTQSATESTTQTGASSPRTTEKVSVPGPSPSPTVPSISTRPVSSLASATVSVASTHKQNTSSTLITVTPSATTLPARPSQPGSATPTQATSPSQGCEPQCTWTDWFDEDYPTPGPNGGDFETLAVLRDAGHVFCEQPEDIECRSELEPQVALEELDQVVVCNVSVGLVCRNREQPRPLGYCHNYHVRLLCCDYSRCASSAATTATRPTTPATTSTPVVPTTGAISPGQPLSPEASPGTTLPPPSTETGITLTTTKMGLSTRSLPPSPTPKATDSPGSTPSGPSTSASTASGTPGPVQTTPLLTSAPPAASMTPGTGTTACQPRCSWSEWLNESSPVPGATGGDFETYASLRAAGHALCKQPVALECRAAAQPDVPLSELGQVVQCRLQDGLVCRNRDQAGRFEMCLDYQVRVLCCDYSHCPATLATTTTTPAPSTWPHSALPSSTSTQSPMAPSTSPAGTTSGCQPACRWTDWLDSDQPLPGRYGGDIETYYHIESVHGRLCPEPVAIQCEAVLFPGLELQQLGQVVQCDVHYGLICRNSWQMWGRNCLNYHVRVQCCDDYSHCASSPAPATSSGTSTGQPTSEGTRVGTSATTEMRPSSPVATASATLSTTQTRVSSPGATASATKSTTETGPSSPGATPSATKSTTETGPSSPGATPRATKSTTETRPSSPGATPSATKSTTETGPSSPGATPSATKSTTETGPSSPGATPSATKSTTETGPSSPGATPSATKSTTETGPSSPGATPSATKSTTETGPSSPGATPSATKSTTETGPSSPGATPSATKSTTETGPSSPGATPSATKSTTETGPSSPGATPSATKSTTETGPSSPGATPSATKSTTETGPSSPGATPRATKSTTEMGPSSPGATPSATKSTTETRPSSARVTTSATKSTTHEGPSSPGATSSATKSTSETGPSSPGATSSASKSTTETVSFSHGVTTSTTFPTPETEAPTPKATPWITMSNTEAGSSSSEPTTSATKSSTLTGPSSPRATLSITESTTQTGASSPRTTERVSVPGPSLSPTIPSTSTRPASSLTSTTVPVVTTHRQTTSRSPGTRSPSTITLPSQPSSSTPPEATSPSQGCEPQCTWTDWFDEDYPTPGPNGGDFETLAVLRDAGHVFCEQPEDIECRSELEPQVALEELDQVVVCNVSVGLVCRNREQPRPRRYCHNYHVRLLCCDYSRCASSATTTATRPTTPATTSTPVVPTTGATSPGQPDMSLSTAHPTVSSLEPATSPSSAAPTSHCFCQAFGQLFSPGDVVYNKTDRAGCRFYAICNEHCAIDRFQDTCPSPSPPTPSVSTPLPSLAPGCDFVDPPRQVNESWTLEDCTVVRCEGHNRIVLLEPTPVAPVTCVNGLPPVKVGHEDEPCDYHYECECSCSGWGDSHYSTFDGTSYSFSDNCTYILVREIRPQLRNLSVLLDNSFCEASPPAARCPRALRVQYQSTEVILSTITSPSGQRESLILFDQMRVTQSFSKNGVQVSAAVATAMSLAIPVIGISITFDGQAFQIQLPYSLFSHNTEGQCGTCTNSQADDCRRPDGTMAPSCQDMASSWLFPESNKEGCWAPPSPPPTASPSPAPTMSTPTPCPPEPLCELLLSDVFSECRDLIPPEPFLSACLSDSCRTSHPATPCQSLEAYAALCRGRGVCSDWRNATGGLCDLTCPPGKVYEPCGPAQPPTCDSGAQSPVSTALAEGCFCPDGQTLFNAYTDVCVPQCPCVGPDGYPKFPGEQWVSNCQECECAGSPVSVRCTPLPCPVQDLPPECGLAGFVAVTRPRVDNPCCSETLCVCNTTTCPQNPPECGPQEELILTQEGGNCCPTVTCRPKLCEYNGTVYGVGATFPAVTPCHTCTCLSTGTQEPTIHCEKDTCMTTCPQGFHYTAVAGQCCGECLQSACFTPDGGQIQPNETWPNNLDNCTEYHCEAENGRFLLMLRPTACPDVSSCRGILRKSGCCYTCEEDVTGSCHVRANMTVLQHGDCVTEVAVNVPFCEGSCPGMSRYVPEAQAMQRRCTCCREMQTHQRTVTLHCPDSTTIQHSYTYVDSCNCEQACVPEAAPDSQPRLSTAELAR